MFPGDALSSLISQIGRFDLRNQQFDWVIPLNLRNHPKLGHDHQNGSEDLPWRERLPNLDDFTSVVNLERHAVSANGLDKPPFDPIPDRHGLLADDC
jgi:hypothetical protein